MNISENEFYDIVFDHLVSPRQEWDKEIEKHNTSNFTPKDFNEWIEKFKV